MLGRISYILLIAALAGAACHKRDRSGFNVTMDHEMSPLPARAGTATITLKLKDGSGNPVSGASISLEGDMSHAGMSPTFANAAEIGPGIYRAPLEFSMGGDWVVLVHLTLRNGAKLERQFEVLGVKSD